MSGKRACPPSTQKGFTLIEMAVVLVVFGVMMSGSVVGFAHYSNQLKADATEEKFDVIYDALSAYSQRYKRLPCPADPDGTGAAGYGSERNGGNCFDTASAASLYTASQGVVPWRELGIPESVVKDGWGRFISYKPAPQLTSNYYHPQMQDNSAGDNDIHDACRSPNWYDSRSTATGVEHTHVDRAKAMFCCSQAPQVSYLGSGRPANWRQQAIASAGAAGTIGSAGLSAGATTPATLSVVSTNAWTDEMSDNDYFGAFEAPDFGSGANNSRDVPLLRAMGHAVTLVSHGGNGFLSYMKEKGVDERLQGDISNLGAANNISDVEKLNAAAPHVLAGAVSHPKTDGGFYDPTGRMAGASDDRVSFMRTDQLYSRIGSASCLRPSTYGLFDDFCVPDTYDDVIYLLDTSGSMDCEIFGSSCNGVAAADRRITVAKDSLREVLRAHLERELRADDDVDMVGYSGFNGSNPQYTTAEQAYFDVAFEAEYGMYNHPTTPNQQPLLDAIAAENLARNGVNSSDYNGDGVFNKDDIVEARIDIAMEDMEAEVSAADAGGCTPVIESTIQMAQILVDSSVQKTCRSLVVMNDDPNVPALPAAIPAECGAIQAEYDTDPDLFRETYNPDILEDLDGDGSLDVEPNAIVLVSDGNDNCSNGYPTNVETLMSQAKNFENQAEAAAAAGNTTLEAQRRAQAQARYDQVTQIYEAAAATINDMEQSNFDDVFSDFGLKKEVVLNIVDVVDNPGLSKLAEDTGGSRNYSYDTDALVAHMCGAGGQCQQNDTIDPNDPNLTYCDQVLANYNATP